MSNLRPRLCVLEKGANGYGFHLHGDRSRSGQYMRLVEPDTPASAAGLMAGDRLMLVNGVNVEDESHQQVVARIRATTAAVLELVVVDAETADLLKKHNLKCQREFATEGIPLASRDSDSEDEDADAHSNGSRRGSTPPRRDSGEVRSERSSVSSGSKEERGGPRPRLCYMKKVDNSYGFNLHSEKSKPGQFIRAVDDDSPAERAGLRPQDKIIEVNGRAVIGMQHSEVVAAIKAGGDETKLLVVDMETDEFFRRCGILPTEEHISGPLPQPVLGASVEKEVVERKVSSSASSSSSEASMPAAGSSLTPPAGERAPEPRPVADSLGLGMSVAQAKERALKKRAAKKAPTMDWSKRNEIFSSL